MENAPAEQENKHKKQNKTAKTNQWRVLAWRWRENLEILAIVDAYTVKLNLGINYRGEFHIGSVLDSW